MGGLVRYRKPEPVQEKFSAWKKINKKADATRDALIKERTWIKKIFDEERSVAAEKVLNFDRSNRMTENPPEMKLYPYGRVTILISEVAFYEGQLPPKKKEQHGYE